MARLNPCPICGREATGQFCKGDTLQFAYEHCGICGGYRNDWKAARIAWNKTTAEWILEKEGTKVDRHTATECAYKNGFAAGMKAAEEKIVRCKECERFKADYYCFFREEDDFCSWGRRRADNSVDAVPVVRCKECKWFDCDDVFCKVWLKVAGSNDFCSHGERREDGR